MGVYFKDYYSERVFYDTPLRRKYRAQIKWLDSLPKEKVRDLEALYFGASVSLLEDFFEENGAPRIWAWHLRGER